MSDSVKRMRIPQEVGQEWVRQSLADGFDVSAAVLETAPFHRGYFYTFVSPEMAPKDIKFPHVPDVPGHVARAGLARFLDGLMSHGASCVVIEDDLLARKHPRPDRWTPAAFVGNRVVHWADLVPGSGAAGVRAIKNSASGYPLNAFVTTLSAVELGLVNCRDIPEGFATQVAETLLAVITSAFDATSFAVWDGT